MKKKRENPHNLDALSWDYEARTKGSFQRMVMLLYFRLFVIGYSSLCVNSLIKHHRFRLATSSLFARSQRTMAAATRPVEAWLDATVSSVDRTVLESLFHSSGDKSLFVDSMLTLQDDSNSISDLLTGFSDKFHNKSPFK